MSEFTKQQLKAEELFVLIHSFKQLKNILSTYREPGLVLILILAKTFMV